MGNYRLQKISNYAREQNISVAGVYRRIESGKCEVEEIDGVKFIKIYEK